MNSRLQHIMHKYGRIFIPLVLSALIFLTIDTRGIGTRPNCISAFTVNYISDGQDHSMFFDSTQSCTINIHFSKETPYHISACNTQSASFLFELYDTKGKLIYSNIKEKRTNEWTLKFDDPMDCSLKLTKLSPENAAVAVNLLIGFKP